MPEGPSIVILKEEVQGFTGQKIVSVAGNSKIDQARLLNQTVTSFKSWGKHFLICFDGFALRIHFLKPLTPVYRKMIASRALTKALVAIVLGHLSFSFLAENCEGKNTSSGTEMTHRF